ncbi:translation initiation factor 2A [Enteropsectra breve]|nr:translation initiation factor 2A [Enteropsectra breve]
MPVVALTERGLIIDVFGPKPLLMKSEQYELKDNVIASISKNTLRVIDLNDASSFVTMNIGFSVNEMKMSESGTVIGLVDADGTLHIYVSMAKLLEIPNIKHYSMSDEWLAYSNEEEVVIYSMATKSVTYAARANTIQINCIKTAVIIVEQEDKSCCINLYHENKMHKIIALDTIFRCRIATNENKSMFLLLVDYEYSKTSYYAESFLYFVKIQTEASDSEIITLHCKEVEVGATKVNEPETIFTNKAAGVFRYNMIKKVHDFGFQGDSWFVCFGNQPACLFLYSSTGVLIKKYSRSVKNIARFSKDLSRVITAGFGNLPGNVEVEVDGKPVLQFDNLGASRVEWLNDDTHFITGTTEYFKGENKIQVFDYYGREKEVMECQKLMKLDVYGQSVASQTLDSPEQKTLKTVAEKYVPPVLLKHAKKTDVKPSNKPAKQREAPQKKRTREVVESELDEAIKIQERLANDDEISIEEQNKIFQIKNLKEELAKMARE